MEQNAPTFPPAGGPPDALREYLAGADASCPSCRYNLRGCETASCPECGWALSLQLKPRLTSVPHWLFGLMIFGWLTIMGWGGVIAQSDRFWGYYRLTSFRWIRQNNRAQSQAIIQQFLSQRGDPNAPSLLPSTGAMAAPVVPPQPTFLESLWTYFVAMIPQEQLSFMLLLTSALVGTTGLMLLPVSRRRSPRFNSFLVVAGSVLFGLLAINYLYSWLAMWRVRF